MLCDLCLSSFSLFLRPGELLSLKSDMLLLAESWQHEDSRCEVIETSSRRGFTRLESRGDSIEPGFVIVSIVVNPVGRRGYITESHGDEGSHHILRSKAGSAKVIYLQSLGGQENLWFQVVYQILSY